MLNRPLTLAQPPYSTAPPITTWAPGPLNWQPNKRMNTLDAPTRPNERTTAPVGELNSTSRIISVALPARSISNPATCVLKDSIAYVVPLAGFCDASPVAVVPENWPTNESAFEAAAVGQHHVTASVTAPDVLRMRVRRNVEKS